MKLADLMMTAGRFSAFLLGPPEPSRVPGRVRAAIQRQEQDSEIVICLAQFTAIGFFAVFYWVSPKTFPIDAPFEPVPVTLAVYATFTSVRLVLALRRALSDWFLTASVVVDLAVLMITIWSFHLQYNQPAALYLKAPTILYVFIIVALRGLRYDPRWVILAGVTACAGWIVLLLIALMDGTVTHSYVDYMTSLKILVGAEVDKIVSFAAVTAVLAITVVRARRLLARAATEEAAASELSRFFSPETAETIKSADQPIHAGDGVLREAAAMFVDLRGFTELASMLDPRSLVALLGEYQQRVGLAIRQFGGSVTAYLGDGVMITFGATRPSATYAADAIAAAGELLRSLTSWRDGRRSAGLPAPGFGIGISSGTVIYGAIGDEGRLEYTVIGDAVNRAAKIQNHTRAIDVRALVSSETIDIAIAQGLSPRDFRAIPKTVIAGIAGAIDLVALG